jgi:Fe-S-cluster containining protein
VEDDETRVIRESLLRYFTKAIPSGDFIAWVAELDGKMVATSGMVVWEKPATYGGVECGRLGYLLNFYTIPERARLRNVDGWCCFYSLADKKCRVYGNRPLGCYLHPVVYLVDVGAVVDELCPMGQTVSERELRAKGRILEKLLKKLDDERKCRK